MGEELLLRFSYKGCSVELEFDDVQNCQAGCAALHGLLQLVGPEKAIVVLAEDWRLLGATGATIVQ